MPSGMPVRLCAALPGFRARICLSLIHSIIHKRLICDNCNFQT